MVNYQESLLITYTCKLFDVRFQLGSKNKSITYPYPSTDFTQIWASNQN